MSARLIYKQWHRNANRKNTPANNAQNIKYIGERVHGLKTPEDENALFGKIKGTYTNHISTKEAMKYVRDFSAKGIVMYRSVISFRQENADRLELNSKERWENYVKYHIYTLASKNHIDINNFEYLAAVHLKEGQPHVHIDFWDTAQKIRVNVVDPQTPQNIRDKLEIDTYAELAEEMTEGDIENPLENDAYTIDNSDAARKELISRTFENERQALHTSQNMLYSALREATQSTMNGISGIEDLQNSFEKLVDAVPKTGRLAYGYLPFAVKKQVDEFSAKLMTAFPSLQEFYDDYVSSKEAEAEMYNSTESNYGKYNIATVVGKSKDNLNKAMGNEVLKAIKRYKTERNILRNAEFERHRNEIKQQQIERLYLSVLRVLKVFSYQGRAELSDNAKHIFGRGGDLSKAEILELIYKSKDKQSENEEER